MYKKTRTFLIFTLMFIGVFRANVVFPQCTITATPTNFGNYDVFSGIPLDTTAIITVNCSLRIVKANLTISASPNSGSFNPRQMMRSGGTDLLNYNIFTDVSRTTIFGDGTGGTAITKLKRPTGRPRPWAENVTIYGRIPPGQDVSVGNYSDTLTVTVIW